MNNMRAHLAEYPFFALTTAEEPALDELKGEYGQDIVFRLSDDLCAWGFKDPGARDAFLARFENARVYVDEKDNPFLARTAHLNAGFDTMERMGWGKTEFRELAMSLMAEAEQAKAAA